MTGVPASSHGGGGLPSQWSTDANGNLTITTTGPPGGYALTLNAPDTMNAILVHDTTVPNDTVAVDVGFGDIGTSGQGQFQTQPGSPGLRVQGNGTDTVARFDNGTAVTLIVNKEGALAIQSHAAPADATLAAGDCCLWFDQTDGASALKIKAKTANGTVASATIPLT